MQSSSQGYQGYRGYPYNNPIVTDVPSIDAATASRWANLPRRPVGQAGLATPGPSGSGSSSQNAQQPQTSRDPVIEPKSPMGSSKDDGEPNPVVYIDLPQAGSVVSQSVETPNSDEQQFVEDTIMYDPFENRRIDTPKEEWSSAQPSPSGIPGPGGYSPYPGSRPNPPNTLNLSSPGTSSQNTPQPSSSFQPNRGIPDYMKKESFVYGGEGLDGFPISPIPISEFPEPPPAYSATPSLPSCERPDPVQEIPPRTQVIVNTVPSPIATITPINLRDRERKNLTCHHCGVRVQTLVIKETGNFTHFMACLVFLIFMPLIIVVYFSDFFKYRNHYCPNCNQLIGYETPLLGRQVFNYMRPTTSTTA